MPRRRREAQVAESLRSRALVSSKLADEARSSPSLFLARSLDDLPGMVTDLWKAQEAMRSAAEVEPGLERKLCLPEGRRPAACLAGGSSRPPGPVVPPQLRREKSRLRHLGLAGCREEVYPHPS